MSRAVPLPILLSIPHGGDRVPPEAAPHSALRPRDIFSDGDACTREIYDLGRAVAAVQQTDIARAVVDLNRPPTALPPAQPDGVVKSLTADRVPVWKHGAGPDAALTQTLLTRYWRPYHQRLEQLAARPEVRLALDCHSMAEYAPAIAPHPGEPRPRFCLSNANGQTAPAALLHELAQALSQSFHCPPDQIHLNDPFQGGHITRRHGQRYKEGGPPWIQIEMNRNWYLSEPWFHPATQQVNPQRLQTLRHQFQTALEALALSLPPTGGKLSRSD